VPAFKALSVTVPLLTTTVATVLSVLDQVIFLLVAFAGRTPAVRVSVVPTIGLPEPERLMVIPDTAIVAEPGELPELELHPVPIRTSAISTQRENPAQSSFPIRFLIKTPTDNTWTTVHYHPMGEF
jgi:hypothetical protein